MSNLRLLKIICRIQSYSFASFCFYFFNYSFSQCTNKCLKFSSGLTANFLLSTFSVILVKLLRGLVLQLFSSCWNHAYFPGDKILNKDENIMKLLHLYYRKSSKKDTYHCWGEFFLRTENFYSPWVLCFYWKVCRNNKKPANKLHLLC